MDVWITLNCSRCYFCSTLFTGKNNYYSRIFGIEIRCSFSKFLFCYDYFYECSGRNVRGFICWCLGFTNFFPKFGTLAHDDVFSNCSRHLYCFWWVNLNKYFRILMMYKMKLLQWKCSELHI